MCTYGSSQSFDPILRINIFFNFSVKFGHILDYDCLTTASGRFVVMAVGLIGMDAMSVFFTDLCWHWWWLSREAWIEQEWVLIVWLISINMREREREKIWWVKIETCQKLGVEHTINNDSKLIGFIIKFMKNYILPICDLIEI